MAKTKNAAAQTNDPATPNTTKKKRSRAKSEYVIEKMDKADGNETTGLVYGWKSVDAGPFTDTAAAIKHLSDSADQIKPCDYRIVVVKWAKTVKAEQKTVIKFE